MLWVQHCSSAETIEIIANALAAVVKQAVEKEIVPYGELKKQIDTVIDQAAGDWD